MLCMNGPSRQGAPPRGNLDYDTGLCFSEARLKVSGQCWFVVRGQVWQQWDENDVRGRKSEDISIPTGARIVDFRL